VSSPFRNVLVGYDGGETSEDAFALARALAGPAGTLTAACTYWWQPLSARVIKSRPGEMRMRAGAEEVLSRLSERERPTPLTVPAPGTTPAHALRDLIEERGYDLVVVGSTHRGKVGQVLAGTTADALLHGGPCAVAVAPVGYRQHAGRLRRIGVAFDGSDTSRSALTVAHALAQQRGAELVVLRAVNPVPVLAAGDVGYGFVVPEATTSAVAQSELDTAVSAMTGARPVSGELLDGDAGHALAQRAADLDLLVAGSKGHGVLGRVVLGSVSHHLMCNSPAPVLVVPPE
jgi:nucleotide-binding universal stress UspA family protein